jgi:hypothetical protein
VRLRRVGPPGSGRLATITDNYARVLRVKTIKPASFQGKHNRSKALVLLMLGYSELAESQGCKLTCRQLSELSGVPCNSIMSRIPKWCEWRLVKRGIIAFPSGNTMYAYSITEKARSWLNRHWGHMTEQLRAYETELTERRGYGFLEALVDLPLRGTPYARTLDHGGEEEPEEEEEGI